ncbi:hypothetical protein D5S18_13235 [Nocardia panacis]|uniref:GON domain-containing protein n=1 Tax=Nocardia panacis TaxID=2340916 RepID=A0A3A4KRA8_9NOCA|nr:hypothetical protein [Nocardia panacis]RJO77122.1 hypothetical protein D5S18_13235 [Nocardia panacis]
MSRLWRPLIVVILGVLALSVLAIIVFSKLIDRVAEPNIETSTTPGLVQEAFEYGGWTLPDTGKVLLVRRQIVRRSAYQIAIEIPTADLGVMLEKSGFRAVFEKLYATGLVNPIAGPDLSSSPNVQTAQDEFISPKGWPMFRRVTIDERSPDMRIVHLVFSGN